MKRYFIYLVVIAIFATSCKKEEDDINSNEGYVVSGTIVGERADWTEVSVSFDGGKTQIVTAPISNKKFSLILPIPKTEDLVQMLQNIPIPDFNAQAAYAYFSVHKGDENESLLLTKTNLLPLPVTLTSVQYLYVDKDFAFKRSIELSDEQLAPLLELLEVPNIFPGVKLTLDIDLNLKKGWNVVLNTANPLSMNVSMKNGSVPSGSEWKPASEVKFPL